MGEPLIGSVICGAVALGMMWWNWQMMEAQKRKGKRVALEAAEAARVRSQLRAEALGGNREVSTMNTATRISAVAPTKYPNAFCVPSPVKLESLVECPSSNSPALGRNPSPLFMKAVRERLQTECITPQVSSPRPPGTGFFQDG